MDVWRLQNFFIKIGFTKKGKPSCWFSKPAWNMNRMYPRYNTVLIYVSNTMFHWKPKWFGWFKKLRAVWMLSNTNITRETRLTGFPTSSPGNSCIIHKNCVKLQQSNECDSLNNQSKWNSEWIKNFITYLN